MSVARPRAAGSGRFEPAGPLRGALTAARDKSISHRAAILGAMCSGSVRITGYLDSADTRSTLAAIQALGARVEEHRDGLVVHGVGLRGARETSGAIDVGNAGTLLRLLPGWLGGQPGRRWTLDGDASIRRRPVDRIAQPLRAMGATIEPTDGRLPPVVIAGAPLQAIDYELPVASAQVKSCVLLAGLNATGGTSVTEPAPSRDHTERMLLGAGASVTREGRRISVRGVEEIQTDLFHVPGDPSSAAFFVSAAALIPGSHVIVRDVGVNWTRTGLLAILERMGGRVAGELERPGGALTAGEPVTDLEVRSGPLVGTVVEPAEVGLAIDELPLVALLGCFAEGETIVRGAQELRFKESDRIATVVGALRALGGRIEATEDGFVVTGTGGLRGGRIDSHGDHRLAMMGAIAGLASREGVVVDGMEAAGVSYPRFVDDLEALA